MRKITLLLILLLPAIGLFAQHELKIGFSSSRLAQTYGFFDNLDYRVNVGYGITDWCFVGVFGSRAGYKSNVNYHEPGNTDSVAYVGKLSKSYFHYGLEVELHPLAYFFPDFHWIDPYCHGELGLRTITERYTPEYDGFFAEPVHNDFLYGGGLGLAVNPSKYFGVFYEYAFDNVNKTVVGIGSSYEIKTKPIHRFGINVRIPIVK